MVGSPKEEYLAIITAYIPDPAQWSPDFPAALAQIQDILGDLQARVKV